MMGPMRIKYLVLLNEYHINRNLKTATIILFNPSDTDLKTRMYECKQYIQEEIKGTQDEKWKNKIGNTNQLKMLQQACCHCGQLEINSTSWQSRTQHRNRTVATTEKKKKTHYYLYLLIFNQAGMNQNGKYIYMMCVCHYFLLKFQD